MLFPQQVFANAAKLFYSMQVFRKLLKLREPEEAVKESSLPEYLTYPNLAPLAKNFEQPEKPDRSGH